MFGTRSPSTILSSQLEVLLGHVPGIRDGNEDAIHDARVTTRRLREALELAKPAFRNGEVTQMIEAVRSAGRALGAVRDADVLHNLLLGLDARFPVATPATVQLRAALLHERQRERRRLVKQLERLSLAELQERITRARPSVRLRACNWLGWEQRLREQVATRAKAVRQAVQHAGGIYFPKRSHAVRMTVKHLRYTLELEDAIGAWHPVKAVRRLKRAQDALGEAHDRQTAIARLDALDPQQPGIRRPDIDATIHFLEAEILEVYRTYTEQRKELIAICRACDRFAAPSHAGRALIAAGVVVPSLLVLGRRAVAAGRNARDEAPADHDEIRIEIPVR
jgi:CHAD domain-containing protein